MLEITRQLFDQGYEPNAILQALTTLLRDLLVAALAPDRQALTTISPASWEKATSLAQRFGRDQLLGVLRALKGTEAQLRHSSQPRLALEVLLAGLLAEAGAAAAPVQPPAATRNHSGARQHGLSSAPVPNRQAPSAPRRAQASPKPPASPVTSPAQAPSPEDVDKAAELDKLWQTILAQLQLPSTQAMLRQQGKLLSRDGSQVVVQVNQGWLGMAQARRTLLEQAVAATLGEGAHLALVGGESVQADRSQSSASAPKPLPKASQGLVTPPGQAQTRPRPQPGPVTQKQSHPHQKSSPSPPSGPPPGTSLESTAETLANFFNGEVVDSNNDAP